MRQTILKNTIYLKNNANSIERGTEIKYIEKAWWCKELVQRETMERS